MPAARQRSRSPAIACAVIAITGQPLVAALVRADAAGRLVAVDVRHLAVHEHRGVAAVRELGQRLGAVAGDVDREAALDEHRLDHELVDRVVLGDEHAQTRRRRWRGAGGTAGAGSLALGRRRSPAGARVARAWSGRPRCPARERGSRWSPVDVSITSRAPRRLGACPIAAARSSPSISGIWASSTTTSYGCPRGRPRA